KLISEFVFVKIINPLTQTAKIFIGNSLTNHAANGAAIIPPTLNDTTSHQLIWLQPRKIIKLRDADTVTKNSLADTVPIAYLGSNFFCASINGVLTGPQPPPPIESKNPATAPCGINTSRDVFSFAFDNGFSLVNKNWYKI